MRFRDPTGTEVDAHQWAPDDDDTATAWASLTGWLIGFDGSNLDRWEYADRGTVDVPTPGGPTIAIPGDWIIREPSGVFDVASPTVFGMDYRQVGY